MNEIFFYCPSKYKRIDIVDKSSPSKKTWMDRLLAPVIHFTKTIPFFFYPEIEKALKFPEFKLKYEINFFSQQCLICYQRRFYKIKLSCCNQYLCENCVKKVDICPFCRASLI